MSGAFVSPDAKVALRIRRHHVASLFCTVIFRASPFCGIPFQEEVARSLSSHHTHAPTQRASFESLSACSADVEPFNRRHAAAAPQEEPLKASPPLTAVQAFRPATASTATATASTATATAPEAPLNTNSVPPSAVDALHLAMPAVSLAFAPPAALPFLHPHRTRPATPRASLLPQPTRRRRRTAGVLFSTPPSPLTTTSYRAASPPTPTPRPTLAHLHRHTHPARRPAHTCPVCLHYNDLIAASVPYDVLPLNLRVKLHFERHAGSSWALIVLADLMADLCVMNIGRGLNTPVDGLALALGVAAAYILADLVSGIASWFTFTFLSNGERACYCDGMRDFARRVGVNCAVVLPFLALLLMHTPDDIALYSFFVYFLSFVSVIPALVDWSGSTSFPPSAARFLRRFGANARPAEGLKFLNTAWTAVFCEPVTRHMEKWVYLASRGTLLPKSWHEQPEARARAFGCDIDPFRRRSEREVAVRRAGVEAVDAKEL